MPSDLFFYFFKYYKHVFITSDTWQKNGAEVIIADDIKWLNEKHIEKQLNHSNLTMITEKYSKNQRKEKQELQECKKQPCGIFVKEDLGIQVIMDCRTTPAVKYRKKLGFSDDTRTISINKT